jgi:hypothetical protein
VYAGDWLARRQILAALGVKEVDVLDVTLAAAADFEPAVAPAPVDRAAEVAAFIAAAGGM